MYCTLVRYIQHAWQENYLTFPFRSSPIFFSDCLLASDSGPKFLELLAVARIARWAWQSPSCALAEAAVLHLILSVCDGNANNMLLHETSRPIQLLLLGLARDRVRQAWHKLYFVSALSASSMEDTVSRRSYAGCLFQVQQ